MANTYVSHGKPSRIIHTRADMILILNTINKVVRYVDGVELSTTLSTHWAVCELVHISSEADIQ